MAEWVKVHEFGTRFEAEIARARMESADIPVNLRAHEQGIFGPGFQGTVPTGVELHVPSDKVDEARTLLDAHEGDR